MYSVSTAAILHTQKNNQKVDNCDKLNNRGGKFEAIKHIPTSNKLQQTTFSNWLSEWPHIYLGQNELIIDKKLLPI